LPYIHRKLVAMTIPDYQGGDDSQPDQRVAKVVGPALSRLLTIGPVCPEIEARDTDRASTSIRF
jgi:hypothetical protein